MFMNVGDATNSPKTLEKWHDKAKLVLSGAKEMAATIVSKIFKCQDLDVLRVLLKAMKCLHRICYYYALQVSHTKMRKTSSFESLYNILMLQHTRWTASNWLLKYEIFSEM